MSNDTEAELAALQRSFDNLLAASQYAIDAKNKELAALSSAHNALNRRAEALEADLSRADITETQLHIAVTNLGVMRTGVIEAIDALRHLIRRCLVSAETPVGEHERRTPRDTPGT